MVHNCCHSMFDSGKSIDLHKILLHKSFFREFWIVYLMCSLFLICFIKSKSFYSIKYGLSIITSNVCHIILVMKTKTMVFPMKWYFKNNWHLYSRFVLKASLFTFCLETFILDDWEKNKNWKSEIIWQNSWGYWQSRRTGLSITMNHHKNLQPSKRTGLLKQDDILRDWISSPDMTTKSNIFSSNWFKSTILKDILSWLLTGNGVQIFSFTLACIELVKKWVPNNQPSFYKP